MTTSATRHHTRTTRPPTHLARLAKEAGLITAYRSAIDRKPRHAPTESLLAALNTLRIDIDTPEQAHDCLKDLLIEHASRTLEPVTVATANRKALAHFRLPTSRNGTPKLTGKADIRLEYEDGTVHEASQPLKDTATTSRKLPDGTHAHFAKLPLPELPIGYHYLRVIAGAAGRRQTDTSLVIAAPTVSFQVNGNNDAPLKSLGLFCPTYAIRSERNLGVGNLSDLRELAAFAHQQGCDLISTLPLLAVFNDDSPLFNPAPYSPVSRRFWNELFIDPTRTRHFADANKAAQLLQSPAFEQHRRALNDDPERVDYRAAARLNRTALDALADHFFTNNHHREQPFKDFTRNQPLAAHYARFRAACEATAAPWPDWPKRMRNGNIKPADIDPRAERRHLFAQFAMADQMHGFSREMAQRNARLYLDLAIGVHPDGFDVWNNQDSYMLGCTVGAPPDPMFTEGQDWGFPPLHPETARRQGYREIIDAIRTHTDHAHFLRLDHVMGFHRLFIIPDGITASEGVYTRYREDELFAVLSLESHRAHCRLIGENLGTVPDVIEKKMTKHKVGKLYVGQFEARTTPKNAMNPVPRDVAASLNTHDLPTFVKHHTAQDVPERIEAGVFNPDLAEDEIAGRKKTAAAIETWLAATSRLKKTRVKPADVAAALYQYLAESDAELVLINIEDLWGETHWQNIPGTTTEHPNWQNKLAKTLEHIERSNTIKRVLKDLAQRRNK